MTLTLKDGHKLQVFGYKVLRKLMVTKTEVSGKQKELSNLYISPSPVNIFKSRRL